MSYNVRAGPERSRAELVAAFAGMNFAWDPRFDCSFVMMLLFVSLELIFLDSSLWVRKRSHDRLGLVVNSPTCLSALILAHESVYVRFTGVYKYDYRVNC